MKKIYPTTVNKLSLAWRQAIAQRERRGFNIKIFFMQYILSVNPFRKHSVFLTDYLIIGSNPILNFIKLKNLLKDLEYNKEYKKISLMTTNSFDYWGYHAFEKEDVWNMFNKEYNLPYKNMEDYFQSEIASLYIPENIDVVFINDFNFSIYSVQKDMYVEGFVLHLIDVVEDKIDIFSQMKNVFKAENNIRSKYYHLLKNCFSKKQSVLDNVCEISFPDKKLFAKDSNIHSHIICAKEIFVSSITHLFNNTSFDSELHIMGEDIDVTRFEHWMYENSFGSANHIANSFVGLEFLAIDDFLALQK